ncbi:MAG: PilZ domain-containing protein [Acidobacteria bacterium]|nr:PilZ domain-containing protein [Acidobacteriota bacterium]
MVRTISLSDANLCMHAELLVDTSTLPWLPTGGVERRGALRFPVEREVRFRTVGKRAGIAGKGKTLNISSTGILFTTDQILLPGVRVEVFVDWPVELDQSCPLQLVATGRVVRIEQAGRVAVDVIKSEFRTRKRESTINGNGNGNSNGNANGNGHAAA